MAQVFYIRFNAGTNIWEGSSDGSSGWANIVQWEIDLGDVYEFKFSTTSETTIFMIVAFNAPTSPSTPAWGFKLTNQDGHVNMAGSPEIRVRDNLQLLASKLISGDPKINIGTGTLPPPRVEEHAHLKWEHPGPPEWEYKTNDTWQALPKDTILSVVHSAGSFRVTTEDHTPEGNGIPGFPRDVALYRGETLGDPNTTSGLVVNHQQIREVGSSAVFGHDLSEFPGADPSATIGFTVNIFAPTYESQLLAT